jgi:hypothetical protein
MLTAKHIYNTMKAFRKYHITRKALLTLSRAFLVGSQEGRHGFEKRTLTPV